MAPWRTAEILAVGSELLTPHRVDTNSLFLTGRLNELGLLVRTKAVVGDDRGDLSTLLRLALQRADVVITSGGLGPTDDDVTREATADLLGLPLREDPGVLDAIERRFRSRGLAMPAVNRRQAQVPDGAIVLPNVRGTAPGLWIETGGRVVVLLPGPPRELKPLFDEQVAPRLSARTEGWQVRRRAIKTTGRSESQVEEIAQPIYSQMAAWSPPVSTTILASPGLIELQLSVAGPDVDRLERALDDGVARLAAALGPVVFSVDGRSLDVVVGDLLRSGGLRIAAAESCTGGLLLGRLTDVPGSSAWVTGGIVAYADRVKVERLGVPPALIAAHGAVSEPVAVAMAEGVRALGAEIGVGITGVAGPDGGSAAKPVGTVVIAVAGPQPAVRTFLFPGERETVRRFATTAALEMVRQMLQR